MIGVTQILIAIFKLGDLTRYISESVVLGFIAGAGSLVAIGQVGNFLGVAKGGASHHAVVVHLWETVTQSGPYNFHSVVVGLGTLLLTLLLRRVLNKYKLPRIDMLVGLIIAAMVAAYFSWSTPKADGKTTRLLPDRQLSQVIHAISSPDCLYPSSRSALPQVRNPGLISND